MTPAREYLLTLALGAAGAGLALLALRQNWAHVITRAPAPLPTSSVPVRGQDLVPVAGALAVAGLATLAAVIATRGIARRLVGALLMVLGLVVAVTGARPFSAAAVLAAGRTTALSQAGSATAGGTSGVSSGNVPGAASAVTSATHVVMVSFPWRGAVLAGALAVVAAGVLVAWRGARWPVMSSRYERPGGDESRQAADSASAWESLSRGLDPTETGDAGRRTSQ